MNQRALLRCHAKYPRLPPTTRNTLESAAAAIGEQHACEIPTVGAPAVVRQELMLREAHAAAHYWRGVAVLVPDRLGFCRRRTRGATDPFNMVLNYGYALLGSRVWWAIERYV